MPILNTSLTPDGPLFRVLVSFNQYDVGLTLILGNNQVHHVDSLPVIESTLQSFGFDVLLGRDVLKQGMFTYNGVAGTMTLAF